MNKRKFTALFVALLLFLSAFIINIPSVTVSASSEIKLAAETDFSYRKIPANNPTEIYINQYLGEDSKIIIPDQIEGLPVTRLFSSTFMENENLEYVEISSNIEYIYPRAFNLCSSLTEIAVNENNSYFASLDGVLYNKDLTTLIAFPAGKGGSFTIPESVIDISNSAFEDCYNLTDVKMHNNVLSIGQFAFAFCWNLSSIKLSDNLQSLGFKALAFCDSLTEIHLPGSLKSIGIQAVIGGIDSDSNWYYNFIDGLYYVPGTASEKYVKSLHVPPKYLIAEPRSFTDIDTGITILDPNNILPTDGNLEFKATVLPKEEYEALIPIRFSNANAYNLSLKNNGEALKLSKDIVINFNGWSENPNTLATKVYELKSTGLEQLKKTPNSPFIGTQTKVLGTYVIAENNDFSLKGDIDGDGVVTTYDTQIALSLAADLIKSITDEQLASADVDGNVGITTEDARKILRLASGMEQ